MLPQPVESAFDDKVPQGVGFDAEPLEPQEVEIVSLDTVTLQAVPFAWIQSLGQGVRRCGLDHGPRGNGQLIMRMRDVEMVDGVTVGVSVGEDLGGGIQLEIKAGQALLGRLSGLHPDFHQALPDGCRIMVAGDVSDFEQHGIS